MTNHKMSVESLSARVSSLTCFHARTATHCQLILEICIGFIARLEMHFMRQDMNVVLARLEKSPQSADS